jgi:hypothetical protein
MIAARKGKNMNGKNEQTDSLEGGLLHREPNLGPGSAARGVLGTYWAHALLGHTNPLHPSRCIQIKKA